MWSAIIFKNFNLNVYLDVTFFSTILIQVFSELWRDTHEKTVDVVAKIPNWNPVAATDIISPNC